MKAKTAFGAAACLLAALAMLVVPAAAQAVVPQSPAGGPAAAPTDSPPVPKLSVTVTADPNPTYTATPIRLQVKPSGGVAPYTTKCNFGDGAVGYGPNFGHSYGTPGLYIVWCKVTDAAGQTAYGMVFVKIRPWSPTPTPKTTPAPMPSPAKTTLMP